ncbi:MAG: DUF5107 domain-containing protein [Spirochaetaceae bacterium]|jgi:tetratricopeptide (TPR) repeat protein|nr:DUF5107 domain-containing protein [Spirochaetaceae bacterium]
MIRLSKLHIKGAPLQGCNPHPFFRARQQDLAVAEGPGFPADKRYSFGRETAFRVLPYKIQDKYGRELKDLEFDTVVLENDFIRAEVIPSLGGRVWSLFDKVRGRDIVYRNPVFQPANLAIREAWFSGGIEWNIGHLGHSVHTCSPVFAGLVDDDTLRLWEYERQSGLQWSIDLSLAVDRPILYAAVQVTNPDNYSKPLYWWTNTAVPETEDARVFSASSEVIYIVPGDGPKTMGGAVLPELPTMPGEDASYPAKFKYSNEYFFQNDRKRAHAKAQRRKENYPWEAVVYNDGYGFAECSTAPLIYRKMFCWGSGKGGRKWQEFLSPREGLTANHANHANHANDSWTPYLEVQAGVAPTQLHTADIGAGETVSWVQAFSSIQAEPVKAHDGDYEKAAGYVGEVVQERFKENPSPNPSRKGRGVSQPKVLFTGLDTSELITDKAALEYEAGDVDLAIRHWEEALAKGEDPFVLRNLGYAYNEKGDKEKALQYYERAYQLAPEDETIAKEYLTQSRKDAKGFDIDIENLPEVLWPIAVKQLLCAFAPLRENLLNSLFSKQPCHIREGNNEMIELWHQWKGADCEPPENIDFRMY